MINPGSKPQKSEISRRTFITQSTILGGALILSPTLSSAISIDKSPKSAEGVVEKLLIKDGWKIKPFSPFEKVQKASFLNELISDDKNKWLQIPSVPAMPHDILLQQKMIEKPWRPYGTEKCFWVSQKDWVYSVKFECKKVSEESRLIFKELKGKVDVYLNNELVASHSDQAHPLMIDVTGKLKAENQLVLHFSKAAPSEKSDEKDSSKRGARGTYLGPNPLLHTSGVVGDVILEHTDGSLINEIITDFSLDDSFTKGDVKFGVSGKSRFTTVKVQVRLLAPDGHQVALSTVAADVKNGSFAVQPRLTVSNPELWWPRGNGEQKLYKAKIELQVNGNIHQVEYRTIGFRKITMPNNLLHFVVNGKPVFLRGGDWVTPNLLSEIWDPERVGKLLDLAENANFNAFRIWGQVEAPNDKFYEMVDERGFLLWHDFTKMQFSDNEKSIQKSEETATKFLKRVKHHPAILMWCGINEAAMWWHEDYNKDFEDHGPWPGLVAAKAVEKVCRELDPDRYFIPSAPFGGVNANDPREGSTNGYTNMWFVPGFDYLNFASEDTRIACPTLHSMEQFMLPEEICPQGYTTLSLPGNEYPFPSTWLPYTTGESWKKTGPVEQFYDANDAASLVNRIGMAQGVYYRDVVERQRRGRPSTEESDRRCCGGYIFWKFNDSWPEIYSAKVDYFLEPYHAYYTLRAAYSPVIISFDIDTFIYLWAVNDSTQAVNGTVKIQLYHLEQCKFRKEIVREISVAPGKSMVLVQLDQAGIRAFRKEHVLFAELKDKEGNVIARTNALADIERRCNFPDAKLEVKVLNNALEITTDKFARNINLEGNADGDKFGWMFEDNYFDLLPGEKKVVRILGKHQKGKITAKAWYSSHSSTTDWKLS